MSVESMQSSSIVLLHHDHQVIPVLSPYYLWHPYIPHFLFKEFFHYLLVSFPFFCIHMHGVQGDIFAHKPIKKVTLVALSYRLRSFVVIHITSVPPSVIMRGPIIIKLQALTPFFCLRLFVVVYIGTNTIYRFLLPEAVCCCLQMFTF